MVSSALVSSPPCRLFGIPTLKIVPSINTRIVFKNARIRTTCKAELLGDGPLAMAISACLVSSLLLPNDKAEDTDFTGIDSTDTRIVVMAIISFIPYFNWLSWVFAWLDTKRRRYAVYSLAYLAPYLRSNFSLSPEESWLPIISVLIGIVHVQLEASIKNGDIQPLRKFLNLFPSMDRDQGNGKAPRDMDSVAEQQQEYTNPTKDSEQSNRLNEEPKSRNDN